MKLEIAEKFCGEDPLLFPQALDRVIQKRFSLFQAGLNQYQNHPYQRQAKDKKVAWSAGSACLRDYGVGEEGYPVFVIPSLVNRYYILDLMKEYSFLSWLNGEGWHPFVLDWGAPGEDEKYFGLDDYICCYLKPALSEIRKRFGRPPIVLGYCMGGTLAAALARVCPQEVHSLIFMATPWDFHEGQAPGGSLEQQGKWLSGLMPIIEQQGEMPCEVLQSLFASLDPTLSLRKFSTFTHLEKNKQETKNFVALEDWLNDGVPLTAKVAQECLQGWYGENLTAKGRWNIGGQEIDPKDLSMPVLSVISNRDRIVPQASSRALAQRVVNGTVLETSLGHIGMVVSRAAQSKIWIPISDWMKQILS